MITFLYGTDAYRIKERVKELSLGYVRFNLSDKSDFARFEQTIKTVGLFSQQINAIITEPFTSKDLLKLLQQYKVEKDTARKVIVIANDDKTNLQKKDKDLFTYLNSKKNTIEAITPLDDIELTKWLIEKTKKHGLKLDSSLARMMILRITNTDREKKSTNNDRTYRLANEIAKLKSYKLSAVSSKAELNHQTPITIHKDDIELLIEPIINHNIFALTDAVASKNRGQATKLLHASLTNGMDPFFVQSMLIFQFRNMLRIKSILETKMPRPAEALAKVGHPYVVQKTIGAVRNYEMSDLKNKFSYLQQIEINTKMGKIELVDSLYSFVFNLT